MRPAHILTELEAGDEARAEAAIELIQALSIDEAQSLFEYLLQAAPGDPDRRWWQVRALAELPVDGVSPALIKALGDDSPAIRQCAARGLIVHPDVAALPALLAMLDDPDTLAARLAADALAALGSPGVPGLIDLLQTGSRRARQNAVRALAKIGDHRSIPALLAALDADSQLMEYWANEGLERMGVGMSFFNPG